MFKLLQAAKDVIEMWDDNPIGPCQRIDTLRTSIKDIETYIDSAGFAELYDKLDSNLQDKREVAICIWILSQQATIDKIKQIVLETSSKTDAELIIDRINDI